MLLQIFTPLAELAVPDSLDGYANISPLPPPSIPIQFQFLTLGLKTSPPYRDQLENPVLLSGAQGLGLESPSKTRQGTQFGPGATSGTGLFPL